MGESVPVPMTLVSVRMIIKAVLHKVKTLPRMGAAMAVEIID